MTPTEIRAERKSYGLSQAKFARLVGSQSGRSVRRWDAGDFAVPGSVVQLLALLRDMPTVDRQRAVNKLMNRRTK